MMRKHVWFSVEHCVSKLEEEERDELRAALYTPMQLVAHDEQSGEYVLRSDDQREFRVRAAPAASADALRGVPDLLHLSDFSEPALLHTLRVRYERDDIYTYVGSILIAINPYRWIASLYDLPTRLAYRDAALGAHPPHLYAIADAAYRAALAPSAALSAGAPAPSRNQSIVISGESGAGKTEATKIILAYLAHVSALDEAAASGLVPRAARAAPADGGASALGWIEQRVLDANPLLEALGNARTLRNHNSSRFGKWIHLSLHPTTGRLCGARVTNYLLEKTRVARQGAGEANFHIFYQILNSARADGDGPAAAALAPAEGHPSEASFAYLQHGSPADMAAHAPMASAEQLAHTMRCVRSLGFDDAEAARLLQLLAAVLHLGNLVLVPAADGSDGAELAPSARAPLTFCASALRVPSDRIQVSLLTSATAVAGETIVRRATVAQAEDRRDALAKAVFTRLFALVIARLNETISRGPPQPAVERALESAADAGAHAPCATAGGGVGGVARTPAKENARGAANGASASAAAVGAPRAGVAAGGGGSGRDVGGPGWIGILDIYGFECVPLNQFEQLLINYANESLQRHFNARVFEVEQLEYARERISWEHIAWADNSSAVALIDGRPGDVPGILATFEDGWGAAAATGGAADGADGAAAAALGLASESSCVCSTATDRKLLQHLHAQFGGAAKPSPAAGDAAAAAAAAGARAHYAKPRHDSDRCFTILHYAGDVTYCVDGFCARNSETLSDELRGLMRGSECGWLRAFFDDHAAEHSGAPPPAAGAPPPPGSARGKAHARRAARLREQSVGSQFKEQLGALTKLIDSSRALFVRCICANAERAPRTFDAGACATQLRYAGLRETVRMRAAGYPVRLFVDVFCARFGPLAAALGGRTASPAAIGATAGGGKRSRKAGARAGAGGPPPAACGVGETAAARAAAISSTLRCALGLSDVDMQTGVSKVFLRHRAIELLERLESLRARAGARAVQAAYRARRLRRVRAACAVLVQASARGARARRAARARRDALVRVQACVRGRRARSVAAQARAERARRSAAATVVQALVRGRVARRLAACERRARQPAPPSPAAAIGLPPADASEEADARCVARLRPSPPVIVTDAATVFEAAKAMAAKRADAALVVAPDGALVGIVTDTDISRKVVALALDARAAPVADAMTRAPTTVRADQSALHALRTMVAGHFRHLPVLAEAPPARAAAANAAATATAATAAGSPSSAPSLIPSGVLDLTRCLYDAIQKMERAAERSHADGTQLLGRVREAAAGRVPAAALDALLKSANCAFAPTLATVLARVAAAAGGAAGARGAVGACPTVGTNANVLEAARLVTSARRAVVVLDDEGGVAGILTSRDILFRVVGAGLSADTTNVTSVMTPSPDCATPSATILEALHQMHDHRYQHMPVLSPTGELLGIVDALQLAYVALGGAGADGAGGSGDAFWGSVLSLPAGADGGGTDSSRTGGSESGGSGAGGARALSAACASSERASMAKGSETGVRRAAQSTGALGAPGLSGAAAGAEPAPLAAPLAALIGDETDEASAPARSVAQLRPARAVLLAARGTSVFEAAKAMAAKRADAALVVAPDGALVGIVTDTDISRKVVALALDARAAPVADAMTRAPTTVRADQSALHALRTMVAGHFRHLPVLAEAGERGSDGLLVLDLTRCLYDAIARLERAQSSADAIGVVLGGLRAQSADGAGAPRGSADAALAALLASATSLFQPTLAQVLQRAAGATGAVGACPTVGTNANVLEAARLVTSARRAVVVLDDEGGVAGILTSRDILFRVVGAGLSADTTNVTSVMTPSPDCATPSATILEALHQMHDHRYQHMPVLSPTGELLGIVDALQLAYHVLGGAGADGAGKADGFWEGVLSLPAGTGGAGTSGAGSASHSAAGGASQRAGAPWREHAAMDDAGADGVDGRLSRANSIAPNDSVSAVGGQHGRDVDGGSIAVGGGVGAALSGTAEVDADRLDGPNRFVFKLTDESGSKHRVTLSTFTLRALRGAAAEALALTPDAATRLRFTYKDTDGDPVTLSTDASVAEAVVLAQAASWTHIAVQISFASAGGWLSVQMTGTGEQRSGGAGGIVPVTREAAKAQKSLFGGVGAMMGLAVVGSIALELLKRR